MEAPIFLARAIGLFGAISTLAVMARYSCHLAIEEDTARNTPLIYLSGFLALGIGVLLVVGHQVWVWDWRVLITIIGWLTVLKGMLRIFFPEMVKTLIAKKKHSKKFLLADIAVFLASLYLLYQGFIV